MNRSPIRVAATLLDQTHSHSIDALRMLAALVSMLAHVAYLPLRDAEAPDFVLNFLRNRSWSSELFFLLSGFILAANLTGKPRTYGRHLRTRFFRLYPIHAATFLVTLPTAFSGVTTFSAPTVVWHSIAWLTMAHGFFPACATQYNAPAWAITSFALGYLAIPFAIRIPKAKAYLILALILAMWALLLANAVGVIQSIGPGFAFGFDPENWSSQRRQVDAAHVNPWPRLGEILMGSWLALLIAREETANPFQRWVAFVARDAALVLAWGGFFAFVALSWTDEWRYLLTHGVMLPAMALLTAATWANRGWIHRFCSAPWIGRAGKASILLYLIHQPVHYMVRFGAGFSASDPTTHAFGLTVMALTVLLSIGVAMWMEPTYSRFCDKLARCISFGRQPERARPTAAS